MNSSTTPNLTTAVAVIALIGAFLFAQHDDTRARQEEYLQEQAAAQHSRNFAARQVCGPDAEPEWVEDKTLVCHRVISTTTVTAGR